MSLHDFFATHTVFTTGELVAYQGDRSRWTRKSLLAHHRKQGRILLVRRGLYAVVPPGNDPESFPVDPYLVAAKSADDSVLAYHTALEVLGKAHSVFERFFFQSGKSLRPSTFRAHRFECTVFPKALREKHQEYFATTTVERSGVDVRVTSLERTLVDLHDRPDLGGGWEEIWRSLESVEYFDLDLVIKYVNLLGKKTTAAKVGYYLQQHAEGLMVEDRHLEPLRKLRPKQPHYLQRGESGKLIGDWNLVVPRSLAERSWEEIARFVHEVAQFKAAAASGKPVVCRERLRRIFTPEFEGHRRGYTPAGGIEARCDHGTVVRRLYEALTDAGHKAVNDRRDLYILAGDDVTDLFEVKTDLSTTSLYQGVGQLMLHGAALDPLPQRILVIPGQPNNETRQALARLEIAVLVYEWMDAQVEFSRLEDVLAQAQR